MTITRTILSTAMLVAVTALTAHATEIEFCTGSAYDPGTSCPGSQPSSGSGTCYNLTVKADTCYTFDDFSSAPGELVGSVGYIYVPRGELSSCSVYRTQNCTVGPSGDSASVGTGSYNLLCRYHIGTYTESWTCT